MCVTHISTIYAFIIEIVCSFCNFTLSQIFKHRFCNLLRMTMVKNQSEGKYIYLNDKIVDANIGIVIILNLFVEIRLFVIFLFVIVLLRVLNDDCVYHLHRQSSCHKLQSCCQEVQNFDQMFCLCRHSLQVAVKCCNS